MRVGVGRTQVQRTMRAQRLDGDELLVLMDNGRDDGEEPLQHWRGEGVAMGQELIDKVQGLGRGVVREDKKEGADEVLEERDALVAVEVDEVEDLDEVIVGGGESLDGGGPQTQEALDKRVEVDGFGEAVRRLGGVLGKDLEDGGHGDRRGADLHGLATAGLEVRRAGRKAVLEAEGGDVDVALAEGGAGLDHGGSQGLSVVELGGKLDDG